MPFRGHCLSLGRVLRTQPDRQVNKRFPCDVQRTSATKEEIPRIRKRCTNPLQRAAMIVRALPRARSVLEENAAVVCGGLATLQYE